METVQNGQCGLCAQFGEQHKKDVLVSIVSSHKADLKIVDECGHPKHASLHLKSRPSAVVMALLRLPRHNKALNLSRQRPDSSGRCRFRKRSPGSTPQQSTIRA
jgi:hypothetical protein